jgi:hypothetical protein
MKRKYFNTAVAVAALAVLWFGFTYWDKRKSNELTKTEPKPAEKIVPIDSSHVQAFTLTPRAEPGFTCRREGGKWVLERASGALVASQKPANAPPAVLSADESSVSAFLNSLTTATVDEVVDPHPSNLKDFGLDPPAVTVEVSSDAKPQKLTLLLGDETPTSGGLYAQVAGNPRLVTLASYLKSSLEKNLLDLRDKRALTLDVDQIRRIEVESKGKHWTLEKNPEGVWDFILPPPVRADTLSVNQLVGELRNLSMQTIVAEDKKKAGEYGFGSPLLSVKLSSPQGSQAIELGRKDGDRYDAVNSALPPIFTLNSTFLTQFQKDPGELRDKDLFSWSTFDVKRLEVDTPKGHWTFEQQKDKWKEIVPKSKDVTADKMDGLLADVRALRAESFPKATGLAALGLTKPGYTFKAQFGEKSQTEIVEASKVGDHVYGRRTTDSMPAELKKDALDSIDKALGSL